MSDEDSIRRSGSKMLRKASHHKGSSGEHPIMQAVRKKLDSIREGTLPELEALNARIDKLKRESDPPDETNKSEVSAEAKTGSERRSVPVDEEDT